MIKRQIKIGGLTVAECIYPANLYMSPHVDSESHIAFILSGSLREQVGQLNSEHFAFSMVCKPAGLTHSNSFGNCGTHLIRISFSQERKCRKIYRRLNNVYSWSDGTKHSKTFFKIFSKLLSPEKMSDILLESLCNDLLNTVFFTQPVEKLYHLQLPWFERCMEFIHQHFLEKIKLRDLAVECGVHEVHLARTFNKRIGCSVGEYIRRLKVNYASKQILKGMKNLVQISYDAGFADQAHFCRTFKLYTGLTPSQYLQMLN